MNCVIFLENIDRLFQYRKCKSMNNIFIEGWVIEFVLVQRGIYIANCWIYLLIVPDYMSEIAVKSF